MKRAAVMMSEQYSISIPAAAEAAMRSQSESAYPNECCGAIFGSGDGSAEAWAITRVEPAPNEFEGDHANRYLVSPAFQAEAERRALAAGLDVIGWYHSHPDDLARPSEYDRSHAWVGYAYRIYSVRSGRAVDASTFTLDGPGGSFLPVRDLPESLDQQTEP